MDTLERQWIIDKIDEMLQQIDFSHDSNREDHYRYLELLEEMLVGLKKGITL